MRSLGVFQLQPKEFTAIFPKWSHNGRCIVFPLDAKTDKKRNLKNGKVTITYPQGNGILAAD